MYDAARGRFGDFDNLDILKYLEEVGIPQQVSTLPLLADELFSTRLPINNKKLSKHYLPFIPSLHLTTKFDNTIQNANAIIIAPSGTGKTGLLVRHLCRYPGILLTGTGSNEENPVTGDSSVKLLMTRLEGDTVARFAFVRQYVQILLLTKLIHIIHMINYANENPSVLESFENQILPFLAFNQFNGSTLVQKTIFNTIVGKLKQCPLFELRFATMKLIGRVKELTKSDQFYVCLDEANVIEE